MLKFLKFLLPFSFSNDIDLVPPEVRKEIEQVLADAKAKVKVLRDQHSVQKLKNDLAADLAAFEEFTKKHVELLKAQAEAKIADAQAVLPKVVLPPAEK